jgi:DNA-directed RNA polymerase specialized sigma24 family protein
LSEAEIAAELGIAAVTVKSAASGAVAKLRGDAALIEGESID